MTRIFALLAVLAPSHALACGSGVAALRSGVPYSDLQAALDDLVQDDVVMVCPGTHFGPFLLVEPPSFTLTSFSKKPRETILSGGGVSRILDIVGTPDLDLTIDSLSLVDGYVRAFLEPVLAGAERRWDEAAWRWRDDT